MGCCAIRFFHSDLRPCVCDFGVVLIVESPFDSVGAGYFIRLGFVTEVENFLISDRNGTRKRVCLLARIRFGQNK